MGKFKEGDIVYHKATDKKGVISGKSGEAIDMWIIVWDDGNKDVHTEAELYTEQEHEDKFPGPGIS